MDSPEPQLKELLLALVAIDTTSSRSNGPIIDVLESELGKLGFEQQRHTYADSEGQAKVNLLARIGPPGTPELALVGHTDCVPYDPEWKGALTLTEKEGRLIGRGACDTKAFVACALSAARALKPQELKKPLLLIFTADEEAGLVGAKHLAEAGLGKARYAIVGEPTSLRPIRGHKGYCIAEVEVLGKEGHSAYPESGASAILRAAKLISDLETYARGPLRLQTDAHFDPPFTTVNVGMISGGRAKNVIPGNCRFVVEWRPIPGQPVDQVFKHLEELVMSEKVTDPSFEARLHWTRTDSGVSTQESSPLVQYLVRESGQPAATVPFGTEAPQLTALGAEAVVFGPGDIRVAHQTGEFVPVRELVRAEEIVRRAISHFCG